MTTSARPCAAKAARTFRTRSMLSSYGSEDPSTSTESAPALTASAITCGSVA